MGRPMWASALRVASIGSGARRAYEGYNMLPLRSDPAAGFALDASNATPITTSACGWAPAEAPRTLSPRLIVPPGLPASHAGGPAAHRTVS